MGQFASVHRALRNRDSLHVALKRWHRPVALARPGSAARQGAAPGGTGEDGPMPCDDEDVACFEQVRLTLIPTPTPTLTLTPTLA